MSQIEQFNLFSPIKESKQDQAIDYLLLETPEKQKIQNFNSPNKSSHISPWQNNNSVKLTSDRLISIRKVLFNPGIEILNQDSLLESTSSNCEEYTTLLEQNLLKLTLDNNSKQNDSISIESPDSQNRRHHRKYNERLLNLSQITLFSDNISPQPCKQKLQKSEPKILEQPTKVLSAPGLPVDYYATPLCSSADSLYIALNDSIYRMCTKKNNPQCLIQSIYSNCICAQDKQLAVGSNQGEISIFGIEKKQNLGICKAHQNRITSLTYTSPQNIFSGSTKLIMNDIRYFNKTIQIQSFPNHSQQICKLVHNKFNENQLFIGTNDNQIYLIDLRNNQYVLSQFSQHTAAVRAILPISSNLFVSGGGNGDTSILVWNTFAPEKPKLSCFTGSQVTNLISFDETNNYFFSTHGYTKNQLSLWRLSNTHNEIRKIQEIVPHSGHRTLYSVAIDQEIITAADEQLKYWKIENILKTQNKNKEQSMTSFTLRDDLR